MKKTQLKPIAKPVLKKAVSQPGKWVYKPIVSIIAECKCGNKYISTRPRQKTCIMCMQAR